jgi:hypothetical protein
MTAVPAHESAGRPERIRSRDAARITGLSLRTIQEMSARSEIPGAALLGSRWTYDEAKLRRWIQAREEAASVPFAMPSKSGSERPAFDSSATDRAYERLLGLRKPAASSSSNVRVLNGRER